MKRVFLSTSIPDAKRHPRYSTTADVIAIRDSVRALAQVVLPRGELVFGGHPAVSPLVYTVAQALSAVSKVTIFQSEFFRGKIPPQSLAFSRMTFTRRGRDLDESLDIMRAQMLAVPYCAGVFIGGMEGVQDEYELFRRKQRGVPTFPMASTGGAAALILDAHRQDYPDTLLVRQLQQELVYDLLFEQLLPL